MSLLTQAYLLDRYGPRLNLDDLAEVLSMAKSTIHNQLGAGVFPVPTYLDGKRYADYRDVATYLDECRGRASLPV